MTIPESPKALVGDGALLTWAGYVLAHPASTTITGLTIAIMVLRLMMMWRQWRSGK